MSDAPTTRWDPGHTSGPFATVTSTTQKLMWRQVVRCGHGCPAASASARDEYVHPPSAPQRPGETTGGGGAGCARTGVQTLIARVAGVGAGEGGGAIAVEEPEPRGGTAAVVGQRVKLAAPPCAAAHHGRGDLLDEGVAHHLRVHPRRVLRCAHLQVAVPAAIPRLPRAALGERRGVGQHARLQLIDDVRRHHVLHHHCAGHRPG